MTAQDKLRRALDIFAVNGSIIAEFDTDNLLLSINGIPFLPSETHALNILYREEVGYQNFMDIVTKTPAGAEAKRYLTPIFDLRSALYEASRMQQEEEVVEKEAYADALISTLFPHIAILRGV